VGVWRGFRIVVLMCSIIVVWLFVDTLKIYKCFNRDITTDWDGVAVGVVVLAVRGIVGRLSKYLLNNFPQCLIIGFLNVWNCVVAVVICVVIMGAAVVVSIVVVVSGVVVVVSVVIVVVCVALSWMIEKVNVWVTGSSRNKVVLYFIPSGCCALCFMSMQ